MKKYNVIMVFNTTYDKLLMCHRRKEPFRGLSNLVGGKIEAGENGLDAAYRELREETGIGKADIRLTPLMDFRYHLSDILLEVYVGKLKREVAVSGDENELYWSDLNRNFFDTAVFAGGGNIGHMLEEVKWHEKTLFAENP